MKTIKFFVLIAALAGISTLTSCSKGDTGATGPQGPAGTNGVANISTSTVSIAPGAWTSNSGYYTASFTNSSITDATNDGVELDFSLDNGSDWSGLPSANVFTIGDQMGDSYDAGNVTLLYTGPAPTSYIDIKVTVIPPASILKKHPVSTIPGFSNQ